MQEKCLQMGNMSEAVSFQSNVQLSDTAKFYVAKTQQRQNAGDNTLRCVSISAITSYLSMKLLRLNVI